MPKQNFARGSPTQLTTADDCLQRLGCQSGEQWDCADRLGGDGVGVGVQTAVLDWGAVAPAFASVANSLRYDMCSSCSDGLGGLTLRKIR